MYQLFRFISLFPLALFFVPNAFQAQTTCVDSSLINPDLACPAVFDPVCGCDGKTYGNACEALNFHGITSWVKGECSASTCSELEADFLHFPLINTNTVTFNAMTTFPNGTITEWRWDFGDGGTESGQNTGHTYATAGTYTVCLTVKGIGNNGESCERVVCKQVYVQGTCFDNCTYDFEYELNGTSLQAGFDFGPGGPPFYFSVVWTLDDVEQPGNSEYFNHLFAQPGIHTLCAQYPTGDFAADYCTVCKAIDVTEPCVDPAQIDTTVFCPAVFDPVCGCDGKTYNNACEAVNYGGISSWKPGVCGSVCNGLTATFEGFNSGGSLTVWTFTPQAMFPGGLITNWFWDFGNGQTSTDESPTINFLDAGEYQVCLRVRAVTSSGECNVTVCKTITVAEKLCLDPTVIDPNIVCPAVFDPVCGCDGKTYQNECIAYYQNGITAWTPGICPDSCIVPAWVDSTMACIEIYDPVCGCNGITYDNYCYAIHYGGVKAWKKGKCCENAECNALLGVEIDGNAVTIKNLSTNAEAVVLDFGDGSPQHFGFFDSLVHIYPASGVFLIHVTISNFAGTCTDSYSLLVNLSSPAREPFNQAIRMEIAPNPAGEQAQVSVSDAQVRRAVLLDIFGKKAWARTAPGNVFEIEMAALPAGVYLLQVQTEKGVATKKLVRG